MADQPNDPQSDERPPTFLQTTFSVLAAFFGVQSRRNRERDFSRGKASHFIIIGLVMTVVFVAVVVLAVKFALRQAGV